MRWVLAAIAIGLLVPATPAVACPMASPSTRPLTSQGDTIADGGGVLLETVFGFGGDDEGSRRLGLQVGGKTLEDVLPIAGSLSLLPSPRSRGTVRLVNDQHKVLRTFKRVAKPKPLTAPKLKAITMTVPVGGPGPTNPRDPYSMPIVTTSVTLAEAPPPEAVAIVFYAGKDARGWYETLARTSFTTQTGGKQCGGPEGGALYTQVGEKLTAAWVDRYGRITARSAAITVGAAP